MQRVTSLIGRRPALLLGALVLFALALSLPAAHPAAALSCGIGCYPGATVTYYTDATRTHVLCYYNCYDDTCNGETSPWYRIGHTCCCN